MKTEIIGEGEPEHAVVSCVHGDERCGWNAFNRFKKEFDDVEKPVKFILANEKAFRLGKRYCDRDLNRVYPGSRKSGKHEEELASRLEEELKGLKTLDIHSSESRDCPFAIVVGQDRSKLELARETGLDRVIDAEYIEGGITRNIDGVVVEAGYKDDQDAAETAYSIMKNFMAAEGITNQKYRTSDIEIYEIYDEVKGKGFEFQSQNFQKVEKGEKFAEKGETEKKADEDFYPVLMSTGGYDNLIGFKARKIETAHTPNR